MLTRQANNQDADWQELDRGPGYFHIPAGYEARVRLKSATDHDLQTLAEELAEAPAVISLDLSENRNITDSGVARLKSLPQLEEINLSSVDITRRSLEHLAELPRLRRLNLSYCNRLDDSAVKLLNQLTRLEDLNIQACMQMTRAGVKRLERRTLTIHR